MGSAEGLVKEPICPIMGRVVGKGSVLLGRGRNETCRMVVVLMMEWMVA